jgi:protein-S-isoprenylcysteine O-methyltransferase Ste14
MTSAPATPPKRDRAGVIAPPPLIFGVAFFLGWFGRNLLPRYQFVMGGAVLVLVSATIIAWAATTMLRANTHVDPYQPTTALVTTGPFRFTRNPLYLSMTIGYVAASLWTASMTSLALLPLAIVILHFGVIRREERYLEGKFENAYREYCGRVRRWV